MTYKADEPKFLWILLFVLTITYAYALESVVWTYIAYGLSFIFFAALTLRYRLEVKEEQFIHTIQVFGFSLLKRTIHANDIEKITIIYLGKKTIILLHLKKKLRIKLQRFSPEGIDQQMIQFAEANNIEVENPN
ncbi:hypothetical protein [Halalkalibacter wakoensis]|uniref:hypothetical protein n=1 Tax=Halalkalibacter wakoensis TaxID=127891 RepID=UPI0005519F3F|nr:hypothetical protein [Halalkalibacter wakoensis]